MLQGRRHAQSQDDATRGVLWRSTLLPEILIIVCTLVVIWFFRRLLHEAQRSDIELATLLPLFLAVMGMALAAGILVLSQASRSAKRLSGPVQRLLVAMQRTRRGDIAHRVHLRQGDSLKEVAAEFNKVLDWLNANPPAGVKTGTDLIEVGPSERLIGLGGEEDDAVDPESTVEIDDLESDLQTDLETDHDSDHDSDHESDHESGCQEPEEVAARAD